MMQSVATIFMNDTKTVGSISGIGSP
jgi:hypothetical protein